MKRITTVATGGIDVTRTVMSAATPLDATCTFAVSDTEPVAFWFGTCGCDSRKWRWRSATAEAPWELMGPLG